MIPLEVMLRLKSTNSRTEKEQIVFDAFMNDCFDFFVGARLAYDSLYSYGVKKVAEILEDDGSEGTFTFHDFLDLATKLKNRELTGHAARDAIHAAASVCHVPTWNLWYRRILLKDFDVGVSDTIINKILRKIVPTRPEADKYIIPVFKCMLAEDGEDVKHQKKIKGKKLIDVKLDGFRVLTLMDTINDTVKCYTRSGFIIENFPELQTALETLHQRMPGSRLDCESKGIFYTKEQRAEFAQEAIDDDGGPVGMVLDGEFMSPNGFQHLMTLAKRKDPHPDTAIIRYALFDVIPLDEFLTGKSHRPETYDITGKPATFTVATQRYRREVLESLQTDGFLSELDNRLYVVPQIEVDLDTAEGQKEFVEFNKQVLDDGFEGVMIKDPDAPYEGKRSTAWLKKKPYIEVTLEIVGFENGKEGKWQDGLGAIVCKGHDLGVDIETKVGAFTDELRIEIWNNKDKYLGMLVELKAGGLTLKEGETVYSLRFPEFKGFRGRVPGEKM